jgi:hypothetical protein
MGQRFAGTSGVAGPSTAVRMKPRTFAQDDRLVGVGGERQLRGAQDEGCKRVKMKAKRTLHIISEAALRPCLEILHDLQILPRILRDLPSMPGSNRLRVDKIRTDTQRIRSSL